MSRRVVLFARVSTEDRGQDTQSQLLALRTVAARFGWQVVAEVPLEISAWNAKTAAHVRRQALAAVRLHRADVLAVWALDRVCRAGIIEAFSLLQELEQHLGATFYSYQEPFLSTATADPAMRSLLLALFAWMAEQESRRKSERVKARVVSKRQRGAAIGQRGKWGRGYLPTEGDIERVRTLGAGGRSLRAIEAETGIPRSTVARILKATATVPNDRLGHRSLPDDAGTA
ncbi:MAG TPA: recombinase family protein [Polyangia bacterium]|jgi:DNA invertase Pin-like site-specific DNA recombinase|nr:recombinase family protein [Polyangia bacterium]